MKEYSTYQEAAIANLGSLIFKSSEFFYAFNCDCGAIATDGSLTLCNHADYCISVSEFLSKGNRANDGDLVIDSSGDVWEVKDCDSDLGVNNFTGSKARNSYVLRAAALEKPLLQTGEDFEHSKTLNFIRDRLVEVHGEPKNLDYMHKLSNAIAFVERMEDPSNLGGSGTGKEEKSRRTKVTHEKLSFECAWRAIKAFEDGEKLYTKLSSEEFALIDSAPDVLRYLYGLYERIETEITEREEFIDVYITLRRDFKRQSEVENFYDFIADSGKFKLVD